MNLMIHTIQNFVLLCIRTYNGQLENNIENAIDNLLRENVFLAFAQ